ncbi:MAG: sulfite exporter TauE/SafE family protein [Slackia sp.]|nr:sulfite exporter TauE/SafE family protein [Slackia sp.]
MFLLAAVCGIGVGMLSGLLGIGGGVVMVPLFRLAFGMGPLAATATSLFTIIPTSLSGMAKHVRDNTAIVRVGVLCGIAGACLSPVGVMAASASPGWMVMAAAASVIAYSSFTMLRKALKAPKAPKASAAGSPAPARAQEGAGSSSRGVGASVAESGGASASSGCVERPAASWKADLTPSFVAKVALIGVVAGFLSGYVGVGGGFIMVPLFMSLLGVPMRKASGTSLLAVCILAVPGALQQAFLGNIDYVVGIATAVGSIPGAFIGASLVKKVPERALRFAFAAFLMAVAVILVLNESGVAA